MVIIILATVMVLGIAFYQVIQGLFSALIMTILTVLCAAVALGYYEPLASAVLYTRQAETADAVALIALFVLPLLGVRMLVDRLIPGNVVFGRWADRIGGGVLGIFSGLILTGVLMVALQMLPFGASVLGYTPFDDALERDQSLSPFRPDEFVIGMANSLSAGSCRSERPYASIHDNLLLELFCARNTVSREIRVGAPTDGLRVDRAHEVAAADIAAWDVPPDGLLAKKADAKKAFIVRVNVHEDSREDENAGAKDWWLLPATHFRLVNAEGKSFFPVAFLWFDREMGKWSAEEAKLDEDKRPLTAQLILGRPWEKQKALTVDWVYLIDKADLAGLKEKPSDGKRAYLVFRRVVREEIAKVVKGMPSTGDALAPKPVRVRAKKGRRR